MGSGKSGKVLIVEDDLLLSMVTERHAKNLGLQVIGKAVSGKEAIQKTNKFNPDLIFMDISLRGSMTGIQAVEEIRKGSNVPVIYLSGSSGKTLKTQAKATSNSFFLTKPVDKNDLQALVTNVLNQSYLKSVS